MTQSRTEVTKENLIKDFNIVITDAEQLLKSIVDTGDGKARALRAKVVENLRVAKERLQHIEAVTVENAKVAARATDDYVHEHPWRVIAAAAGLGVVIGLLLNRR